MTTDFSSKNTSSLYNYIFEDLADPRVKEWFLMQSPSTLLTIVATYLYFIFIFGPRYMKHREAFNLKYVLIAYNFLQMLLSIYLVVEVLDNSWLRDYNLKCEPVDYSWTPKALRIARGVHTYHLAKVSELLDTVFFVLRKKTDQITFLHVYHHASMCLYTWGITKYIAGGQMTLVAILNSLVHVIMYFYYMVAAFGSHYQKYLWWKKYITSIQLVQFVVVFLHSIQVFFYDCGYPKATLLITMPNSILFYLLFSQFYSKAYKAKSGKRHVENCEKSSCEVNRSKKD